MNASIRQVLAAILLFGLVVPDHSPAAHTDLNMRLQQTRSAVQDLVTTFGNRYPDGPTYLDRLSQIETRLEQEDPQAAKELNLLRASALLANPLLAGVRVLAVRRRFEQRKRIGKRWEPDWKYYPRLGMPSNHECNSSLERVGWDNEIAVLDHARPDGHWHTLFRPQDRGYVGEIDLNADASRLMFTRSDSANWKIWEIGVDGKGLRQISRLPDRVDCMDAMYLPDGRIIFGSTACYQSVPCWHGQRLVTNLYIMNADGGNVRRLCYDQDHNFHPTMMENGQVLFNRWDYTGIEHIFLRQLMVMNPDGTGQRAIYGSNTWFPNSLYFSRPLPSQPNRLISILSGYHGPHRMGQLVLIDTGEGWHGKDGLVQRISGRGEGIQPAIRDDLVRNDWPKFLHPFPLSDKYFLVAAQLEASAAWGIYLADVFDNLIEVKRETGWALLEPMAIRPTKKPPIIPDRVDTSRDDAVVYVRDVYAGRGLQGVPRNTVKQMRVIAYDFGYPGLAGPDKVGYGGPWEVMRILGTVPVDPDGSAMFRVPANTPLALQPLDSEGKAVQLMRSWYTAMPGESVSCVGCHETPHDAAPAAGYGTALAHAPSAIHPWYGPARGFDFQREVQPVLDRYCVDCHDGSRAAKPDLRGRDQRPDYKGLRISALGIKRLDPVMLKKTGGRLRYSPSYDALIGYIRRVGIEDDVSLLTPGEYYADTSPLIQLLRKGHGGVTLDAESWDRLVTWIDLNAPCHGTWSDVWNPIPNGAHQMRMRLRKLTGGPKGDPEFVPAIHAFASATTEVAVRARADGKKGSPAMQPRLTEWPLQRSTVTRMQANVKPSTLTIKLRDGQRLTLVRIPAGNFIMGDATGQPDEQPPTRVSIDRPFWIGKFEVTNAQFRCFDAEHDSRYYNKRHLRADDQGITLNQPRQPVVRVSWQQALAFCQWLSHRSGRRFSLPTEAQWEWAARAGSGTPLWFGVLETDPVKYANLAGREFSKGRVQGGKQVTGGVEHLVMDGAWLADTRFDDGAIVTEFVGCRAANEWGVHDMAGNVAEWTLSAESPYPYRADDGRNIVQAVGRKIVRGGSFFDPPRRARSSYRLAYPYWMPVFNVGFRVVCE